MAYSEFAMRIPDEAIQQFRELMRARHGVDLDAVAAKTRYLQLLNLFWILAHRAPKEGEPPSAPPPPPWL